MTKNSGLNDLFLEANPCGIILLDSDGQIQKMSPALTALLGIDAGQFIGHITEKLGSGLRGLFKDTGAIQYFSEGRELYLYCQEEEVGERGRIRFYFDISELVQLRAENIRLRQKIQELAVTDDLTGLPNARAFTHTLESHITRSRRYQNPLSLVVVELLDQSAPDHPLPDELILLTSRYLRDRLRWVDLIARWDQNQFIIALPETRMSDCNELVVKLRQSFLDTSLPKEHKDRSLKLHFGVAEWHKGFDSKRLIKQVTQTLYEERDAD